MKKFKRRIVVLAGSFTVLIFVAVLVFVRFNLESLNADDSSAARETSVDPVPKHRVESLRSSTRESPIFDTTESLAHIWSVCPVEHWAEDYKDDYLDVRSQVTEKCVELIGNYVTRFPKVLAQRYITSLLTLENPMTYERIFADPVGDRAKVLEALVNTECQFNIGELVRWDLQETCNAVEIANYTSFLSVCSTGRYLERWHNWNEEVKELLEHSAEHVDPWDDFDVRTVVFQKDLESTWVYKQCKQSGIENLLFDHEGSDREIFRLLQVVGNNIGEQPIGGINRNVRADVNRVLLAIAARLGEEWATLEYRGTRIETDSWDLWIQKVQPWRKLPYPQTRDGPPTIKKVGDAVDFIIALEDAQLRVDWELLVSDLCYVDIVDWQDDTCQLAVESLSLKLDPFKYARHIEVLTKIKEKAVTMRVYANPSLISRDRRYLYRYSFNRIEEEGLHSN